MFTVPDGGLQVGNSLGRFGNKVLTSSKDIFEHVAEAVQSELDEIEGHIGKPKKAASSKASRHAAHSCLGMLSCQLEYRFTTCTC